MKGLRYTRTLVGLSGYAGAGKDEVGKILVNEYGFKRFAFADAVRQALYALNPRVQIGTTVYPIQTALNHMTWDDLKNYPEVRGLLQRMGTEVGRDLIGPDTWVNIIERHIDEAASLYGDDGPVIKGYVITDCRFVNEAEWVVRKQWDPEWRTAMVRVNRPGVGPRNNHVSETGLDNWKFDYVLMNDKGLGDLAGKVHEMHEEVAYEKLI